MSCVICAETQNTTVEPRRRKKRRGGRSNMSMWSDFGPLGSGMIILLFMIKYYFLNKSLKEKERIRKAKPYVSMRQRKIDGAMERRR